MSDFYVPANTLPALAGWVADKLSINAPELLHLSDHQKTAQINIVLSESSSFSAVLQAGCDSLGVINRFNALGQLQLVGMGDDRAADYAITYDDIKKVDVASELPELTELRLRHNYDHEDSQYYGSILVKNASHHYPAGWSESAVVDTVISTQDDALEEANRRARRRFIRRRLYKITCLISGAHFLEGDRVNVFHPQWGLNDTGTIWQVERLPGSNEVTIEVEI